MSIAYQGRPGAAPAGTPTADGAEAWKATRAHTTLATQFLTDQEDYLSSGKREIGRRIAANERELFVSCDPGPALQQQFEHVAPTFIAMHDLGSRTSRKLLVGIAAACGRPVQKLRVRRQGFGTALATLEFVELPTTDGSDLAIYSTDADAGPAFGPEVAQTLLAHSRLAVALVSEANANTLESAMHALRERMLAGPWPNRQMLVLPLAGAHMVTEKASVLGVGTRVDVRTTPLVARPADAWSFIQATWTRVRDPQARPPSLLSEPEPASAETQPMPMSISLRPLPSVQSVTAPPTRPAAPPAPTRPVVAAPSPAPATVSGALAPATVSGALAPATAPAAAPAATAVAAALLERYVKQLNELAGMVSCCVFELSTGRACAHAGASPRAEDLARQGAQLITSIAANCRVLGLGHAIPDAAITLGNHHVLLRAVPRHPGLAMHAVLDKAQANLTLVRLQVQRMDPLFDEQA